MSGDFFSWWFDTHYILSTIFSPAFTFLWLIFTNGSGWRMTVCVLLSFVWAAAL